MSTYTRGQVLSLLERFRERCAHEGDYEVNGARVLGHEDMHAKYAAKHIREIDVAAWLSEQPTDALPEVGETWEDGNDGERVLVCAALDPHWYRCKILVPVRSDVQRGLGPPPGDNWERRIVLPHWARVSQ